jgi:ABC-type enterobactin transport system permease subunit
MNFFQDCAGAFAGFAFLLFAVGLAPFFAGEVFNSAAHGSIVLFCSLLCRQAFFVKSENQFPVRFGMFAAIVGGFAFGWLVCFHYL